MRSHRNVLVLFGKGRILLKYNSKYVFYSSSIDFNLLKELILILQNGPEGCQNMKIIFSAKIKNYKQATKKHRECVERFHGSVI